MATGAVASGEWRVADRHGPAAQPVSCRRYLRTGHGRFLPNLPDSLVRSCHSVWRVVCGGAVLGQQPPICKVIVEQRTPVDDLAHHEAPYTTLEPVV